jgi:hypothetical protein
LKRETIASQKFADIFGYGAAILDIFLPHRWSGLITDQQGGKTSRN